MTSHTSFWPADDGSIAHPDVELLADLAEDLVDPDRLPALQQHLAHCQDCADTHAALGEVRDLLGAVDAPPMPAEVAARIDAALAAEAASAQAVPTAEAAPVEAPRTARPSVPASASPPNRRGEATGPGRARRRGRILAGATALLTTLGLAFLVVQQLAPTSTTGGVSASSARAGGAQQQPALTGGPVYRDDALPEQIRQLISAAGPSKAESVKAQPRNTGNAEPEPAATAALPGCVLAATGHGSETPLATGPGHYGPSDVTALVYPLPGRSDQVDVYLVTSVCPGATVVLHRTVPSH